LLAWSASSKTLAVATFVVMTITDSIDGTCTVALCSLRDAVIASNANPGGNTRRWR